MYSTTMNIISNTGLQKIVEMYKENGTTDEKRK